MTIRILPIIFISLIVSIHLAATGHALIQKADRVLVIKNQRRLILMNDGKILKSYRVALGRQPVGDKVRRGDGRTPEGRYHLDRRNARSRFYRSIHISYPSSGDMADARKRGVDPGEGIMIHGLPRGFEDLGELHSRVNWTRGCIAVSNREMDEIWALVPDGTPIEIRP